MMTRERIFGGLKFSLLWIAALLVGNVIVFSGDEGEGTLNTNLRWLAGAVVVLASFGIMIRTRLRRERSERRSRAGPAIDHSPALHCAVTSEITVVLVHGIGMQAPGDMRLFTMDVVTG